ncbi:hypothetical protein GCM10023215_00150 [Pseudonocardia yuanmonensis]|uniref:Blue (type 1) copper domain-containing protein n=1 Tax=Pseudonocardia yuanmonensis TaxID=1095914 RepID=A0ABP8VUV5_9PSEU
MSWSSLPSRRNTLWGNVRAGPTGGSTTGSLGEVSASCAADSGDGIVPATTGWTTLTLPPGRYELVCHYPGHYRAGMYAELDLA